MLLIVFSGLQAHWFGPKLAVCHAGCDMAARTANIGHSSAMATENEIRAAFRNHKRELTWMVDFLTDDELMASACIADACDVPLDNEEDELGQECAQSWRREATIRSALDLKRSRIAELSSAYEGALAAPHPNLQLSADWIELALKKSDVIRTRLDSLCRFVTLLCCVDNRSVCDAALLLGISRHAVEVAYGIVLDLLEAMYCQALMEAHGGATA